LKEYIFNELKNLKVQILSLNFKVVFIFLSVAFITFLSITIASPVFYYENFSLNRFYSRIYWFLMDGSLMLILPVIFIKTILRDDLKNYGFTLGDKKFGIITSIIFFIVMLVTIWFASGSETFSKAYPQGGSMVKSSFGIFILYELCILYYMLGWEFFWRGFMLFGLKEKFGYYTVLIQMIPFFILHKGKPEIELFASIFAGLILGIQALRANSFIYAWLLHASVMFFIDGISILRSDSDNYGTMPIDFFNLIKSIF
jgi:uncharacterized protein